MDGIIRELKPCPFCGFAAVVEKEPLWEGEQSDPLCYLAKINCPNPRCEVNLPRPPIEEAAE